MINACKPFYDSYIEAFVHVLITKDNYRRDTRSIKNAEELVSHLNVAVYIV